MATRDIIVIGASAGGVQALYNLVSALPANLPAAVFIVLHIPSYAPSLLPEILSRESQLTVAHAIDGEKIEPGRVYVAPPDRHLLIEDSHVQLVNGPKENLHRPSIDTLFRSAARWAGPRVIGTVLTGARDDGTAGMRAIKQRGGIAIVQDPLEAPFPSMPLSVLQGVKVDYSLPLNEIAPLLDKLTRETAERNRGTRCLMKLKLNPELQSREWKAMNCSQASIRLARYQNLPVRIVTALYGKSTTKICSDIVVTWGTPSPRSLSQGQALMLEVALWSAVRALEEQAVLASRIVERARKANHNRAARLFEKRVQEAEAHSSTIRQLLLSAEKGDIAEPVFEAGNDLKSVPDDN